MANNNTRLELTWIGKENRPKLEPWIHFRTIRRTPRSNTPL